MARNSRERPTTTAVRLGPQGRVVIPAGIRAALELHDGDVLAVRVQGRSLVMESPGAVIDRIQARFATAVPPGVSLVDELLAERRAEALGDAAG